MHFSSPQTLKPGYTGLFDHAENPIVLFDVQAKKRPSWNV